MRLDTLEGMADIFAVIADPTRRELLRVLSTVDADPALDAVPERSVGELVVELGLSQPTVSKHLRVLREAGLVHVREEGQHRYYSIDGSPLVAVGEWLAPFILPVGALADDAVMVGGDGVVLPLRGGVPMPAPLRRAAENLPDVGDVGATLGRAVAGARAGARSRFLEPAKKRLGHREQG